MPAVSPGPPAATSRVLVRSGAIAQQPRFSPDGRHVVYAAADAGPPDLWVVDVGGGAPRRLTVTPYAESAPAWSPDGATIAFVAARGGPQGIWGIPAAGGEPSPILVRAGQRTFSPDFARDGRLAATVVRPDSTRANGDASIWVMRPDGTDPRQLTTHGDAWHARWDARGEWLLYYVGTTDELRAVHAITGEDRNVDGKRFMGWHPAVSPRDGRLAFVSSPHWSLWMADDASARPVRLTHDGEVRTPAFSPDGEWIAFSHTPADARLDVLDLTSGARREIGRGTSLTAAPAGELAYLVLGPGGTAPMMTVDAGRRPSRPVRLGLEDIERFAWSPTGLVAAVTSGGARSDSGLWITDERRRRPDRVLGARVATPAWCGPSHVAYARSAGAAWQAFRFDLARGKEAQLTHSPAGKQLTGCAPDGRWITYRTFGTAVRSELVQWKGETETVTSDPAWRDVARSPDGRALAYVARAADGWPDVFLRTESGEVRRLTNDAQRESGLVFSSDGRSLGFAIGDTGEEIRLLRAPPSAAPHAHDVLTPVSVYWDYHPAWSPDGRSLAFCSSRGAHPRNALYVMDAQGRDVRRLTNPDTGRGDCFPAWAPDGARIAFTSDRSGQREVYLVQANGGAVDRLTSGHGAVGEHVAWTPDGRQLLFSAARDGASSLFTLDVGSGDVRPVPGAPAGSRTPAASPDGRSVAYEAQGDIWVQPLAGGESRRVTSLPGNEGGAHWTPDGTSLLFYSDIADPQYDLYRVGRDGGAPVRVTSAPNWDLDPAVSPDGRRLAWHSSESGRYGIIVSDLDGGRRQRLTNAGQGAFSRLALERGVPRALTALRAARAATPDRRFVLSDEIVALVHELVARTRVAEAAQLADSTLALFRDSVEAFELLGVARRAAGLPAPPPRDSLTAALLAGDVRSHRAAHQRARALHPRWQLVRRAHLAERSRQLLETGRVADARAMIALVTDMHPEWPIGWRLRGEIERAAAGAAAGRRPDEPRPH